MYLGTHKPMVSDVPRLPGTHSPMLQQAWVQPLCGEYGSEQDAHSATGELGEEGLTLQGVVNPVPKARI